ncbi:MAG: hypothetical protein A2Y65_02090 [Deltaproteobacteria bacterium RBG_13_52_11]|nr:MAG: hypothetical protein A2Y65_02090 [Deltaproteobacteria bacterium RBG_13_52_11]
MDTTTIDLIVCSRRDLFCLFLPHFAFFGGSGVQKGILYLLLRRNVYNSPALREGIKIKVK